MTHVKRKTKKVQIKFKTSILRSSLCDYGNTYILVSGIMTIDKAGADNNAKQLDEKNKAVIIKNCASFTDCISKINITHIKLWCQCIIHVNTTISIRKLQDVCDNITEMIQMIMQYILKHSNLRII